MLALSSLAPPQRARLFEALVSSDIITTDASHDGVTVVAQLPAHLLADISSAEQKGRVEGTVGHVTENPPSPRTPHKSLPWLRRFIDDVLAARWQSFSTRQHADTDVVDDLSCHLFRFISCRHGVGNSVRRATETVLLAVQDYRGVDLGVQLFSALLSSGTFDTTDVHFFIVCRLALEPFVVLCPETRDPTLQFVRARHVPALLRKCVRGHPMAGRVLRRCLAASPRWLDAHGRTPDVARDPRYYAPPFSNEHAYVSQPSTPAVDEGRFDSFDAALLVPAAQLLAVLLLNSKEERLHPSLQTTGAEALRRRQPSVSSMTTASFARARVKVRPAALDLPVSMDDYTELYRAAAASPEVPLPL